MIGPRRRSQTPLGRWIWRLVRGHGTAAQDFLHWLLQDSGDCGERLVRALTEACLERSLHGADLADAIRHLESPTARRTLAVWACVAELARNGHAQSRNLWHGHEEAGRAGGLAGRLGGVCAKMVRRALDALEASGALKRWQAPLGVAGVVRAKAGHAYQSYWLGPLPRAVVRAQRKLFEAQKRPAPPPEAVPRFVPPQPARPPRQHSAAPGADPPRWSGVVPPEIAALIPSA